MTTRTIKVELGSTGVAQLTLARPDKHNALNLEMIRELTAAAHALAGDPDVRGVVLGGDGPSFCAGGDLDWMHGQIGKVRSARIAEATELAGMLRALDTLPKPLIGRVHGPAYGGGVGLMAVCDIVIAADTAKFALTEARLGLIPATIGPFLVRRIGERGARRFMFSARTFNAAEASAAGLVSAVVPLNELDGAVENEVAAILQCAPGAVAAAKELTARLVRDPGGDHLAWTVEQLADRWESDEAKDGLEAFFGRRLPPWSRPH